MEFLTAVAVFCFDVSWLSVYFLFEEDLVSRSRSSRSSSFCERRCVRCGGLTNGFFVGVTVDGVEFGEFVLDPEVSEDDGVEGVARFFADFDDVPCPFPFADERDGLETCLSVEDDCDWAAFSFCVCRL